MSSTAFDKVTPESVRFNPQAHFSPSVPEVTTEPAHLNRLIYRAESLYEDLNNYIVRFAKALNSISGEIPEAEKPSKAQVIKIGGKLGTLEDRFTFVGDALAEFRLLVQRLEQLG
jgi:hypothetical protein